MKTHRIAHAGRLEVLAATLRAHKLTAEMTERGLRVVNPQEHGCCAPRPSVILICRPHEGDGGRLWYSTAYQDPIAEADHVTDAVVALKGLLNGQSS
jgi:hypothetical protein